MLYSDIEDPTGRFLTSKESQVRVNSLLIVISSLFLVLGGGLGITFTVLSMNMMWGPSWVKVLSFMLDTWTVAIGICGLLSVYRMTRYRFFFANLFLYGVLSVIITQSIRCIIELCIVNQITFSKKNHVRNQRMKKWQYVVFGTILFFIVITSCCCIGSAWHHKNIRKEMVLQRTSTIDRSKPTQEHHAAQTTTVTMP